MFEKILHAQQVLHVVDMRKIFMMREQQQVLLFCCLLIFTRFILGGNEYQ